MHAGLKQSREGGGVEFPIVEIVCLREDPCFPILGLETDEEELGLPWNFLVPFAFSRFGLRRIC